MKIYLIILLLTYLNIQVKGQCEKICLESIWDRQQHLCVSETEFKRCIVPTQAPDPHKFKCPNGTVCTNDPERCVPNGKPVCIKPPSKCNICDPKHHVACISKNLFAFCFNGKVNLGVNNTCGLGFCQSDNPSLCAYNDNDEPSCDRDKRWL